MVSKTYCSVAKNRADLIGVIMADVGKTMVEADTEVSEAIDFVQFYLKSFMEWTEHQGIQFSAKGTAVVASPWNFSCAIPIGNIISSLISGNVVIFKPSPFAVGVAWQVVQLFWRAGFPKESLQFINCDESTVGDYLIQHKHVDYVMLTGSNKTAEHFLTLRPDLDLIAETGGKNAIIVTELADLDEAISGIIKSAFSYSGQKCSATSLLLLEEAVYNNKQFLQHLADATASLHVGSTWDLKTVVGPLISKSSNKLKRAFNTCDKGEKWLLKPQKHADIPNCWSPGIKLGVKPESFMASTELFGPILGVMKVKNLTHAISIVNNSTFGLTSGLYSLDKREQNYWYSLIDVGNGYINRATTGAIVQRQPFGGRKKADLDMVIKLVDLIICCN